MSARKRVPSCQSTAGGLHTSARRWVGPNAERGWSFPRSVGLGRLMMMAFQRCVSVLAFASFALQFGLSASGVACVVPGTASSHAADMADMNMGGGPSTPAQPADHQPCNSPFAPSSCHSMGPCTPVLIAGPSTALSRGTPPAREVAPLIVLAPPSPTAAPEPPPPKA